MAKKKTKINLFKKIKAFFVDVVEEGKKVIWTSKKSLIKYSAATLIFMVFICLFFEGTNLLIGLLLKVKELIG